MSYEPRTLNEHIDCLARLTGANESFVTQVRSLFTSKGISLDADAGPFVQALEEAFRREEGIRSSPYKARQSLAKIHENFQKVGKAYVDQIAQLKKIQSNLRDKTQRLRKNDGGDRTDPTHVMIKGDHRTFVTRFEREMMPMVPGPKDPQ